MADDYPYMMSNNKIKPIIEAIHDAAKPSKFSYEFLKQLGFTSSNDRAVIPLLKRLNFLGENGLPTNFYDDLKDKSKRWQALGNRIRETYSDIFSINTNMQNATEEDIKGAMSRVTGRESKAVDRYYNTFKTLCDLAEFESSTKPETTVKAETREPVNHSETAKQNPDAPTSGDSKLRFHYNIQIHLPATTDISVYNAIFKSLKDNLNI